jgi:hypothetical protein
MRVTWSIVLAVAVAAAAVPSPVAAQAPDTDIWLAPLRHEGDSLVVGPAINVTHRAGYDNQPAFTPDSRAILYTAQRDGQTDIWRYDLRARSTHQLTHTPESEYSATVMPGGRRFSVIRVERDSVQRLWSFTMNGTDPQIVLGVLRPIGYHLWLSKDRLATYVLGTPSTLHVIGRDGGRDTVIAHDIGRALQLMPGTTLFSYAQRDTSGRLRVMGAYRVAVDPYPQPLTWMPDDNEYHTWTPDGAMLSASKGVLVRWNGKTGRLAAWLPVANLAANGLAHVSRLAVSPDGRWLAFVAEPPSP